MRVCLTFLFLLGATFASSVKGKSHGKHHGMQKTSHSSTEKDVITMEANMPLVLPTSVTFEAGSPEQEDEEVSSEDNTNAKKGQKEVIEKREKSPAILLSEEELIDLLKKEAEEAGEREEEDDDMALTTTEGEVTLNDEKKPDDSSEAEKMITNKEEKMVDTEEEEDKVEEKVEKPAAKLTEEGGQVGLLEETESSTESKPPADLYFAGDSEIPEAGDVERVADQNEDSSTKSKEKHPGKQDPETTMERQELMSSPGLKSGSPWSEEEEEKGKNDSGAFTKRKTRKQKKNKRARKHSPQRNETHPVQDHDQLDHQEFEGSSTENKVHHPKRKRTGKWDVITMEANMPLVLPTSVTFETRSPEQEDEEVSSEDNTNGKKGQKEVIEKREKSPAILLSEEELIDLLKKEAEEAGEREEEDGDMALTTNEGEVTLNDEKKPDDSSEAEKMITNKEEKMVDNEEEEDKVEEKVEKPAAKLTEEGGQVGLLEETESSTESKPPADLYFAGDSERLIPVQVESEDLNPSTKNQEVPSEKDLQATKKEKVGKKELLMQDMQYPEAGDVERVADQNEDSSTKSKEKHPGKQDTETTIDRQELKSSAGPKSGSPWSEEEEEKGKNDSGAFTKRKTRKQKKNKRARKHSPQRNETHPVQDHNQLDHQEFEGSSTENKVHHPKRKRTGKWGPLVGVNPVQIRAAVVLYPRSRSSFSGDLHLSGTPPDPCENFRCKRGKTCKLDGDGKPGCVCQEPLACPPSMNEFEHVCGTDNKTYDTSCELFATKCNLEGTKTGHKLHLDYLGPCKLIPQCVKNELVQFPLRMRDWLKNVLLQLYEQDSISPGFLTPKQRFKVKKIFENERRLHAGNHSVELLTQDFEKNYNMYIYPVHWEFAQLDQHPSDRILSHSELAPLRVPLVPMEHCIPLFFQECDADKDKQITLKEWTSCFGIKDEDMDVNLLF